MASRADDKDGSCREILTGKHRGKWRVQFIQEDEFGRKFRLSRIFPNKTGGKEFLRGLRRVVRIETAKKEMELTLGAWFDWLAANDWLGSLDEKTIAAHLGRFNKHVRPTLGGVPLTKIDRSSCAPFTGSCVTSVSANRRSMPSRRTSCSPSTRR